MAQIILNSSQSYKLSELAETVLNSDSDLIYIVKQDESGNDISYAVTREKFLEGISGGSNGKYIVSGGAVWTGTGLVFDVSNIVFNFFGNEGTADATQITLDNGDSQPRFDVIVVDSDGNIEVVKGTPASSPAIPAIGEDQIAIQPVLIAAGATVPTITQEFVYRNDAEWTTSTYGSGTGSIDFQSTDDPYEGTFCIDANVTSGIGNRFVIPSGDIDLSEYTSLTFFIRFDTALPSSKSLLSSVWNNGSTVGNTVNFMPYGIDRNEIGTWQQITIPTSAFNAGTIDRIQIRMNGAGGQVEYFLDYIVFSTGSSPSVIQPDIITIQDDGSTVGARPKLNFIEGTNVTLTIADNPSDDRVDITIASTGSSGASWGSITGTLSDQTDLQNALNLKLESGDNVSELLNDAGYLTSIPATYLQSGDNVSELVNDAGYLQSADISDMVESASAFANDNRLVRTDGTARNVQQSGVEVDDNDNISGANEVEAASYSNASVVTLDDTSGLTANLAKSNFFTYTLTANQTLNAPSNLRVCNFQIRFIQDGTGSRTVDFAGYKAAGGTAPTLSTAANAEDIITFFCDGTNTYLIEQLDFQTIT